MITDVTASLLLVLLGEKEKYTKERNSVGVYVHLVTCTLTHLPTIFQRARPINHGNHQEDSLFFC